MKKSNLKRDVDEKVKCDDFVNSKYQHELCALENCFNQEIGNCTNCPCKGCDDQCMTPSACREKKKRPKFKKKMQ